jgi:hypothetical protein
MHKPSGPGAASGDSSISNGSFDASSFVGAIGRIDDRSVDSTFRFQICRSRVPAANGAGSVTQAFVTSLSASFSSLRGLEKCAATSSMVISCFKQDLDPQATKVATRISAW